MKDILSGHMEDLAAKALRQGYAASRFLTPAEQQSITKLFTHRNDINLEFHGGYEGAERSRAIFLNPDWGSYEPSDVFAALQAEVPPQETIGHRDILGALMALGIERDTLGDILEEPLTILCLPELRAYITENLTKAGRCGIKLSSINLDKLPARRDKLTLKTDTVASLRLDAVLAAAFGLSRGKAVELIETGRVNLDYELCLQPAKEMKQDALLSVRGLGRARLLEVGGVSKKGRVFVTMGLYGR